MSIVISPSSNDQRFSSPVKASPRSIHSNNNINNSPTKIRNCARYKGSFERRMQRLNRLNKEIGDLHTIITDKQSKTFELIKAINKRDGEYQACIKENPSGGMRSRSKQSKRKQRSKRKQQSKRKQPNKIINNI
jgi:hypothetical protein